MQLDFIVVDPHDFACFKNLKQYCLLAADSINVYFIRNSPNLLIGRIFVSDCQFQTFAS